ncbi:hypothetical protein IWX50DRAFT_619174 [Phyllosticta citricarpa]|uniref:Uncharacterized protein n=1 Tax=Phyllosticta citricarpa TaxID=55181 RepID=A0ABR1L3E3_9PEZI
MNQVRKGPTTSHAETTPRHVAPVGRLPSSASAHKTFDLMMMSLESQSSGPSPDVQGLRTRPTPSSRKQWANPARIDRREASKAKPQHVRRGETGTQERQGRGAGTANGTRDLLAYGPGPGRWTSPNSACSNNLRAAPQPPSLSCCRPVVAAYIYISLLTSSFHLPLTSHHVHLPTPAPTTHHVRRHPQEEARRRRGGGARCPSFRRGGRRRGVMFEDLRVDAICRPATSWMVLRQSADSAFRLAAPQTKRRRLDKDAKAPATEEDGVEDEEGGPEAAGDGESEGEPEEPEGNGEPEAEAADEEAQDEDAADTAEKGGPAEAAKAHKGADVPKENDLEEVEAVEANDAAEVAADGAEDA